MGRAVKGQGRAISCTSEPPSLSDYVPKNREGEGNGVGRLGEIDRDDRYNGGLLLGTILDDGPSRLETFYMVASQRSCRDPSLAVRREKMEGQRHNLDENHDEIRSNGTCRRGECRFNCITRPTLSSSSSC